VQAHIVEVAVQVGPWGQHTYDSAVQEPERSGRAARGHTAQNYTDAAGPGHTAQNRLTIILQRGRTVLARLN
jgi:hypothetical protein